jgi:hypothetical protein
LGFAGQVSSRDGSYWHSLLPSGRIAYIEGYTDAMYITAKKLETLDAATRMLHWKGAKKIFGLVTSELDFSGHTADDLMDSLNGVYSDPKYRRLKLGQALQLALARSDASASENHAGAAKS